MASPGYKWFLVAVLFVMAGLNYADRGTLSAVFPLLRNELGMSDVALAATSSLFLWSYALCSPLAGVFGDRFSRSGVVVWSLAVWSAIMILNGLARTGTELLVMRVPLGIAESLYVPASIALIGDHHGPATRGKAFSFHLCGFYAGVVVGGTLSGYLGERYGWRVPMFVLGIAGLLFAAFAKRVLVDRPEAARVVREGSPKPAMGQLFRIPTYWFLVVEAFLLSAVTYVLSTWLPLFFHESFGMDLGTAAFRGTFAMQAGGVLGVTVGGFVSDAAARRDRRRRMLIELTADFVSAPLLLAFLLLPQAGPLQVVLFLFSFVRYLGGANSNPLACDLIPPQQRALAFGVMNLATCLSAGAGILFAGMLKARFGLTAIFASASVITLAAGLVLLAGYVFFFRADLKKAAAT